MKQLKGALQVEEPEKALREYGNQCCPHPSPLVLHPFHPRNRLYPQTWKGSLRL